MPHTKYSIVCYSILNQCEVASNMARYDGVEYGYCSHNSSTANEMFIKTRSAGFNDIVKSRILAGNYFLLSKYILLCIVVLLIILKTFIFIYI